MDKKTVSFARREIAREYNGNRSIGEPTSGVGYWLARTRKAYMKKKSTGQERDYRITLYIS